MKNEGHSYTLGNGLTFVNCLLYSFELN